VNSVANLSIAYEAYPKSRPRMFRGWAHARRRFSLWCPKSLPLRSDHALRVISLGIQNSFIGTFPIYPDFLSATNTGDVPFGTPETTMENTLVRRDQFNITPQGIVHKPTDAAFTPYAGDPYSGTTRMRQLGNNPPNGSGF
jgi:hypothetical protein